MKTYIMPKMLFIAIFALWNSSVFGQTNVVTTDASGKVTIKTEALDVSGSINASVGINIDGAPVSAGAHTPPVDADAVAALGFVTGAHTVDTDTHGTDSWTDGGGQVTTTAKVGIGTGPIDGTLDVRNADTSIDRALYVLNNHGASGSKYGMVLDVIGSSTSNYGLFVTAGGGEDNYGVYAIAADNYFEGRVGIGVKKPTSKLHVKGAITVDGSIWVNGTQEHPTSDYVFEKDYELMPLKKLSEYVGREKHLPNIPGADEIKENGLDIIKFQMQLLEKVEELTLYTIAQQKKIEELEARLDEKE